MQQHIQTIVGRINQNLNHAAQIVQQLAHVERSNQQMAQSTTKPHQVAGQMHTFAQREAQAVSKLQEVGRIIQNVSREVQQLSQTEQWAYAHSQQTGVQPQTAMAPRTYASHMQAHKPVMQQHMQAKPSTMGQHVPATAPIGKPAQPRVQPSIQPPLQQHAYSQQAQRRTRTYGNIYERLKRHTEQQPVHQSASTQMPQAGASAIGYRPPSQPDRHIPRYM